MANTVNVAIFVSGNGSNCENLLRQFASHPHIKAALVVSSNAHALALQRAKAFSVPTMVVDKVALAAPTFIHALHDAYHIDFIILAGFLLRVPDALCETYRSRMINLHPALLPKYGGKGMYGHHVHEAVKANGETQTGYTIHWVSSEIDGGTIITQRTVDLLPSDTADDIAGKEHQLEMDHFASDAQHIITTTLLPH